MVLGAVKVGCLARCVLSRSALQTFTPSTPLLSAFQGTECRRNQKASCFSDPSNSTVGRYLLIYDLLIESGIAD